MKNLIYVGSDHAGYSFKIALVTELKKILPEFSWIDLGCHNETSCDYPSFAEKVAVGVVKDSAQGLLICGSGIGVAIAANKIPGVRAATVWDDLSATLSRGHNDSNIICLGSRLVTHEVAVSAVSSWLKTSFEGGRHQKRIELISALEKKYGTS